ncbi:cytochrome b/b6 domain-containing protein [Buttiauxella sp. 3AFRM03]|jgi:thiosulfate reductase cytochrome b subunit|uniref:cytochrome b/b6 domain-containing protein n=1 Tax=Buttiauxella TaxID=82976 RepID=UPI000EF75972|nr:MULTISPECIES: cytochrome b/b6 domain-containing protein [Buttiauxella]AYN28984.1 cytochrome b/b6 domain-containing protein [Buttiauxella sp. 3AFRM03]MCE0827423.1 cytochrome b/b6 domain-containing protein [Buttiauxella ferragutiae]
MERPIFQVKPALVHPLWLRICHWLNALAMLIMVTSGWRIYNASPLFNFTFPAELTLGGWLGGALQWHFAGMWLFGINGVIYLLINIFSGRLKHKFWPLSPRALANDFIAALRGKLAHEDLSHYNTVQKLAYLFVMIDGIILVSSGLVVWKSVQFPLLRELLGGYDNARFIHFYAMSAMVGFVVIHLIMVALVPRTLLAMLRGR